MSTDVTCEQNLLSLSLDRPNLELAACAALFSHFDTQFSLPYLNSTVPHTVAVKQKQKRKDYDGGEENYLEKT
jgi:hypothetical protein